MGLKKTNHTIEELGLTLPNAYATIRTLNIYGDNGTAEFVVQSTRENCFKLQPLKTVFVEFDVNRNENPYVTAYNKAKSIFTYKKGEHTMMQEMPFYGWEDDYHYDI